MSVVLPMVAMVFFCTLYGVTYAWMRRPEFGEAKRSAVNSGSLNVDSNPKGDLRLEEPCPNVEHEVAKSMPVQVEELRRIEP